MFFSQRNAGKYISGYLIIVPGLKQEKTLIPSNRGALSDLGSFLTGMTGLCKAKMTDLPFFWGGVQKPRCNWEGKTG